jgi:hypothetical protein
MHTLFKLTPESKTLDLDLIAANKALTPCMRMEERSDGVYIVVETAKEEDEEAHQLVQRELDRIFFLTCVRISATMCSRRVYAEFPFSYRIHGQLPPNLVPQAWNSTIALQLRLWNVAVDIIDPATQILIYFQIIELACPNQNDYPKYTDESRAPHPRTEAKLLRHLVAHAGEATNAATRMYLRFLGLGPVMADRSNPLWLRTIAGKVRHVQTEAHAAIKDALSIQE